MAEQRKATRRMVLELVNVVVVSDEDPDAYRHGESKVTEAWVERGEFEGERQLDAIYQYAGRPGTAVDEAKLGTFRAPPLASWNGGARYSPPEDKPKVAIEVLK